MSHRQETERLHQQRGCSSGRGSWKIPLHPCRSMEKGADPSCSSASGAPSSAPSLKEELLCPICYDPFREAVTLPCGHNFCKGCVSRSWENRRHACPVCKENSSLEDLRVNHTLNNLVEMILKEEGQRKSRGAALCPIHHEDPKFFCLEDKELACFACQNSKQHEGHKMRPVQEAAADFRVRECGGGRGMDGRETHPETWVRVPNLPGRDLG